MADRYCGNCGNEQRLGDRFCPSCGQPAHETAQAPTPEANVPTAPPPSDVRSVAPQGPTGGLGDRLIKLAAALCTGLIVVGLLHGFLALGGAGLSGGAALLVFLFVAGYSFHSLQKREKRGKPLVRTAPVRTRSIPQWVKIAVATRDGGKCRRCGSAYDLQYDHIIPYSRGGSSTDVNNIQLLCGRCNRLKSNRYVG